MDTNLVMIFTLIMAAGGFGLIAVRSRKSIKAAARRPWNRRPDLSGPRARRQKRASAENRFGPSSGARPDARSALGVTMCLLKRKRPTPRGRPVFPSPCFPVEEMARPERFERPTLRFV